MLPGNLGGGELLVILLIALLVLGPDKLPGVARNIGKAMGEFRRMSSGFQSELRDALKEPVDGFTAAPPSTSSPSAPAARATPATPSATPAAPSPAAPSATPAEPSATPPAPSATPAAPSATPSAPSVEREADGGEESPAHADGRRGTDGNGSSPS